MSAIVAIVVAVALLGFVPWVIMVTWGALASTFDFQTIGFGTAILVSIALAIIGSIFKN